MDKRSASRLEQKSSRLVLFRTRIRRLAPFVAGILCAFAALLLYNLVLPGPRPLTPQDLHEAVAEALASATPMPALSARAYEAIQPSLVQVETKVLSENGKVEGSLGAGVVIDERGSILTSLHVVKQAIEINVIFADGTESPADMIGSTPENDIAVLRAFSPPDQLVPATLGNPRDLQIGDEAFAVGNPFGLSGSMSAGIISGLNRTFQPRNGLDPLKGMIQFDAAVNPGNSGGPLLNRNGEVVGVVTGLSNPTGQDVFIGIGFAVPIDVAASAAGSPPY